MNQSAHLKCSYDNFDNCLSCMMTGSNAYKMRMNLNCKYFIALKVAERHSGALQQHILKGISVFLVAKCSTMFTR